MNLTRTFLATVTLSLFLTSCSSTKEATGRKENAPVSSSIPVDNSDVEATFIDATKAKMLENYEEALKLFQKCVKLDPKNHAAMYEMATIYFMNGDYELCYKQIKGAVELEGGNKWYLLLYAEALSYKNQFAEAATVYEKLLKLYPNEYEFYFDWAFMLIKAEKFDDAIKVYDQLEQKVGLDENVIIQKQKLYVRMGKIDKAAIEIKKLIDANPGTSNYYKMLADLYDANNMTDKAAKIYEDLLKLDENDPNALLFLAEMHRKKGEHELSMSYLKKAFKNPAMNIDAKIRILFPYLQKLMSAEEGRKEEAFALAQLIIEAHPNEAKSHAIYGDLLYQDKQSEEALVQYKLALELDSSVFEIWQQMFFIYSELRQNEELVKVTDAALALFPNQPIIYFFNGTAQSQLKNYKKAVEILLLGEPLVIDNVNLKGQFNSSLGDAYNSLENYVLSDSSFEKSLRYDPKNAFTLNNYSYYLSLRDINLEHAKEMSAKSNELSPDNSSFEDTYAWILYRMGEYSEALKWIEKAMKNGGDENSVIMEHYGDILFKLDEVDKAVIYWQKAKELGSESELIGRKIADRKMYE